MKYQITGLTKDSEYEECIKALEHLGIPFKRQLGRIAPFDTREQAEVVFRALTSVAPNAYIDIREVPDSPVQ